VQAGFCNWRPGKSPDSGLPGPARQACASDLIKAGPFPDPTL
jgi:hypothetical protein